jgi:hypothetical protein
LDEYAIRDPALNRMSHIVADTVAHVMQDRSRAQVATRDPHVSGVLTLAEGTMLLSATDHECLARCLPMYDAIYARLQAQIELEAARLDNRCASVLDETTMIAEAVRQLRKSKAAYTAQRFAAALNRTRT